MIWYNNEQSSRSESFGGKLLLWEVGGVHRLPVERARPEALLCLKEEGVEGERARRVAKNLGRGETKDGLAKRRHKTQPRIQAKAKKRHAHAQTHDKTHTGTLTTQVGVKKSRA